MTYLRRSCPSCGKWMPPRANDTWWCFGCGTLCEGETHILTSDLYRLLDQPRVLMSIATAWRYIVSELLHGSRIGRDE